MAKNRKIKCPMSDRTCEQCGCVFSVRTSSLVHFPWKFCSRACSDLGVRKGLKERFLSFVSPPDERGCILWTGAKNNRGYGVLRSSGEAGKATLSHRIAYELANGPIPKGMNVLHRCDVRACVNHEHLFLGTIADNNADMRSKGRHAKGERVPQSKLNLGIAREIRARYALGGISQSALGKQYGINQASVSSIIRNESWLD